MGSRSGYLETLLFTASTDYIPIVNQYAAMPEESSSCSYQIPVRMAHVQARCQFHVHEDKPMDHSEQDTDGTNVEAVM